MSASQDKSQKFTFVYSNLYQIYRKEKEVAVHRPSHQHVLKTADLRESAVRVEPYSPTEFIRPKSVSVAQKPEINLPSQREALEGLKKNLNTLNDLHSRLRFMLQELEELVKNK